MGFRFNLVLLQTCEFPLNACTSLQFVPLDSNRSGFVSDTNLMASTPPLVPCSPLLVPSPDHDGPLLQERQVLIM